MNGKNPSFSIARNSLSLRRFSGLFFCATLIFLASGVSAQRAKNPPNFTPPPLPSSLLEDGKFAAGLNADDVVETVAFVDETTDQVFRMLEALTGKMVLRQESLPSPLLNFNSNGSLTRLEAVVALETLLGLNGISVTSMGEKFLKAIPTSGVRYHSPDMIFGSSLSLPASHRYYSKVFPFHHLNMEEVTKIVNSVATPGLSVQLPLTKAKAIMVTDSLANLQQIEKVLKNVDVQTKMDAEMIFRSLNYISALELKDRLDSMIEGPLKRFLDGDTHIEADERTNQIVIITEPGNVDVIEQVISSLDVDAAPLTRTEVYYLKYADAVEVAPLLNSLISGQSLVTRDTNQAANKGRKTTSNNIVPETPQITSNSSNTEQGVSDQFSPYITIESDERSNSIIAFGTASDIRYIENLIEKIDVVLPQVKIDVIIAEVNIGDKYNRGIDSFGINIDSSDEITVGLNQLVDSDKNFTNQSSNLPFRVGGNLKDFTLNAVFQTAETDSDVSIISSPTLMTTHNKEASIVAGEKRPLITGSSTDSTGSSTRSEVDFTDIAIELTFKPLIGSNGVVQLEIEQTVDTVNGTTLIDGNEQPIIGSRSATSYVSVADGDVIVLGGLQEVEKTLTEGKMFLLGQIPLLGNWLFSSTREETNVQDLVIFIRPKVIYNTDDSNAISRDAITNSAHQESIQTYLNSGRLESESE